MVYESVDSVYFTVNMTDNDVIVHAQYAVTDAQTDRHKLTR